MEQKRYSKEDIEELVKADLNKKGYEAVNIFTHTQGVLVDVKKLEREKLAHEYTLAEKLRFIRSDVSQRAYDREEILAFLIEVEEALCLSVVDPIRNEYDGS